MTDETLLPVDTVLKLPSKTESTNLASLDS